MQTEIAPAIQDTPQGREADAILRSCVHCGFCLATCPTYLLLGDELDSPRGRIYLMKQLLESQTATSETQLHLDRCLTCRACETTCPSGVKYGRLLDIGREMVEEHVARGPRDRFQRYVLRKVLPYRRRFAVLLRLGQLLRGVLPASIRSKVPERQSTQGSEWPAARHARKVVLLQGCVQPSLAPGIDLAAARVLDRIGLSTLRMTESSCCGAVSYHLSAHDEALDQMRRNVDAIWPHVAQGAEAVVVTASACTAMVADYGRLLQDDPNYARKAAQISARVRDLSAIIAAEGLTLEKQPPVRVAFHSPCTLQHALKVNGVVESLLRRAGYELTPVADGHLCCGSAGTYSLLQSELSQRLLSNKVAALEHGKPQVIATANIGCLTQIGSGTTVPVRHWIELLADRL